MESTNQKDSLYQHKPYSRTKEVCLQDDYELNLATLLALEIVIQGDEESWLAFNAAGIGKFDDVIVNLKNVTYFIQLKHVTRKIDNTELMKKDKTTKGDDDFSIYKYAESITEFLDSRWDGTTKTVAQYCVSPQIFYIIYTNTTCKTYDLLEEDPEISNLKFLNTGNVYKIKLTNDQFKDIANTQYCNNIRLLLNQKAKYDLQQLVEEKIGEFINQFALTKTRPSSVASEFFSYIKKWANGSLRGVYCLTRRHILSQLTYILFSPYQCSVTPEENNVPPEVLNPRLNQWGELIKDKRITVVNAEESHKQFLMQYIYKQVNEYYQKSIEWDGIFKFNFANFTHTMEHITGKAREEFISLYKCLWFEQNLPLLLEMECKEIYELYKFIKAYSCQLKFIIIHKSTDMVDQKGPDWFLTLQNLDERARHIIKKKKVNVQGRIEKTLSEVVPESAFKFIRAEDTIDILLNKFNIGDSFGPLPEDYIKPQLLRFMVNAKVLNTMKSHYYILENHLGIQLDVDTCSLEDFQKPNTNCHIAITNGEELNQNTWKGLKSIYKNLHYVKLIDQETLELIKSSDKRIFKKCQILPTNDFNVNENKYWLGVDEVLQGNNDIFKKTVVIHAMPAIGKSTLMNYISKKANKYAWILNISLSKDTKHLDNVQDVVEKGNRQHLSKLYEASLSTYKNHFNRDLSLATFEKTNKKDILILMDGFNEIPTARIDNVTKLVRKLQTDDFCIWITSRSYVQHYLKNHLDIILTTLRPVSEIKQQHFLSELFTHPLGYSILHNFFQQLLTIPPSELTTISRELNLLAEVFLNPVHEQELELDLLDLCNYSFNKMFHMYHKKKFASSAPQTRSIILVEQHQMALEIVFGKECVNRLQLIHYTDLQNCVTNQTSTLQEDGELVPYGEFKKEEFSFSRVHPIFAEFLAAQWLYENYKGMKIQNILEKRYTKSHERTFKIFDLMLAENHLQKLVIKGNTSEVKQLLDGNPHLIKDIDKANRTVLHLIALYDQSINSMSPVIDTVSNDILESIGVDSFGYHPVYYAIESQHFNIANKLIEKLPNYTIKNCIRLQNKFDLFYECYECNYMALFEKLLQHFTVRDLLAKNIKSDENIKQYCSNPDKPLNNQQQTFLNSIKFTCLNDVVPLNSDYKDLRLAVVFGNQEDVESLLRQGCDPHEVDIDNKTSFHYAENHERLDILDVLSNYKQK